MTVERRLTLTVRGDLACCSRESWTAALDALVGGIEEITRPPTALPEGWDTGVVAGLSELTGSLGSGVDSVEIAVPGRAPVVLDTAVKKALKAARRSSAPEWRRVTGRLHMGSDP